MNLKLIGLSWVLMIIGAMAVFTIFQRQFSGGLLNVALDPQVSDLMQTHMRDQKTLSRLQPEEASFYRLQFEKAQQLLNRHKILEHNRQEIAFRFQWYLMTILGGILAATGCLFLWSYQRREKRLHWLQSHLESLSAGKTDILISDHRRDTIGRIARMIERTSRVIAVQRQRLRSLENLSNWQEAARRHAHEIRTPLTAARMELEHMVSHIVSQSPKLATQVHPFQKSVLEELDRLKSFTQSFTSFAKVGKPKFELTKICEVLNKFSQLFHEAWPNLEIDHQRTDDEFSVELDAEMVRQVLVNLCNNSSLAMTSPKGRVTLSQSQEQNQAAIQVKDNGPGIPPELLSNLFEPYVTTRKIGEGMGLGLAIARKIMLDHGGDLILSATSGEGTHFKLLFPLNREVT